MHGVFGVGHGVEEAEGDVGVASLVHPGDGVPGDLLDVGYRARHAGPAAGLNAGPPSSTAPPRPSMVKGWASRFPEHGHESRALRHRGAALWRHDPTLVEGTADQALDAMGV